MFTPEQQAAFVEKLPEVFVPIAGRMGTDGNDPHPAGCSQTGGIGGRLTNGMEATGRKERKIGQKESCPGGANPSKYLRQETMRSARKVVLPRSLLIRWA